MTAISNIVMIVEQLASASMANVAVAVKSVPEGPFALIKDFVADVRSAGVVNDVSISDVVNYAPNVMEVECVPINYVVTDAQNAGVEIYANMVEIRTGVSPVMDQMYANMIRFEHNVSCARATSFVPIKSVELFVENALASTSVLTRSRKMSVWNVRERPYVNIIRSEMSV